ncbi:MAG: hypothetical protein JST44_25565 [Cyanobacteria bacterium SZAS LIN-5]|nr:hypothetical protein [Cyanobacteria bacterium SZAS LIN-5]
MPCKRTLRISSRRNRLGAAGLAEFAPTIFVLVFITFPLINLMGAVTGYACATLAAWQAARRASVSYDIPHALEAMSSEVTAITASGFGNFARLEPIKGFKDCGSDLYIEATDVYSGKTETYGPNVGIPPPVDTASHVYEAMTKVTMNVGPAINMAAIPGLSNIPGLGKPAQFQIAWRRAIEHPENMTAATRTALAGGTAPFTTGPLLESGYSRGGGIPQVDESDWNYPTIYDMIAAAGETVIDDNVIQVFANNSDWTPSGLDVQPGDKIWIDMRADGEWNTFPSQQTQGTDADGYVGTQVPWNNLPGSSMIGTLDNGAHMFLLGKQQWNMVPPTSGKLSMMMNDDTKSAACYADNTGVMNVRIIIAR